MKQFFTCLLVMRGDLTGLMGDTDGLPDGDTGLQKHHMFSSHTCGTKKCSRLFENKYFGNIRELRAAVTLPSALWCHGHINGEASSTGLWKNCLFTFKMHTVFAN